MREIELKAAAAFVVAIVKRLLTFKTQGGREAADLRRLAGALQANAQDLISSARVAQDMAQVFTAATTAGAGLADWRRFRQATLAQDVTTVPEAIIKNGGLQMALIEAVRIISEIEFISRTQVAEIQSEMALAFDEVIETASDDRAVDVVRDMSELQAGVARHLAETSRPLPDMIDYKVPRRLPSLVIAHQLYHDAGRADELIAENGTIHPAFMLETGKALSR